MQRKFEQEAELLRSRVGRLQSELKLATGDVPQQSADVEQLLSTLAESKVGLEVYFTLNPGALRESKARAMA